MNTLSDLHTAVSLGHEVWVRTLLGDNPDIDVNQKSGGETPLHRACLYGHSAMVATLLGHPGINVNLGNQSGETPFLGTLRKDNIACLRLLLQDSRVDLRVNPSQFYWPPLVDAGLAGKLAAVRWMLASGRVEVRPSDVARVKKGRHPEVTSLLEEFRKNPEWVRRTLGVELDLYDETAAAHFATFVFMSDGLLVVKGDMLPTDIGRFFTVAARLPLELQMLLCNRAVGSMKTTIPGKKTEEAFRSLAKVLFY